MSANKVVVFTPITLCPMAHDSGIIVHSLQQTIANSLMDLATEES